MRKMMIAALALVLVPLAVAVSEARNSMLDEVNATCSTNYTCGLCHVDPRGGGPLTPAGTDYAASGYDACSFCPNTTACGGSACTDNDRDRYFAEANCGTAVDCNDNSAAVFPGAVEICNDNIDNDCDGNVDCADSNCIGNAACAGVCIPTSARERKCGDGIDNDCDGAIDCADSDCRKHKACK
jgi:hypothetical protein